MPVVTAAADAFAQAWPPFALVAGLLAIGTVADAEGLFAAAAARAVRAGRSRLGVLAALLGVEVAVTAVLNLDTAVAFMTPLMIYAARGLGAGEAPFLYGAVLMANAASLFLPGSNLTNLLVLSGEHVSGSTYAWRMLPGALAAVAVTAAVLLLWARRVPDGDGTLAAPAARWRPGPGSAGVVVATALVLALRAPALPVLALGALVAAAAAARGEVAPRRVVAAVGPATLVALLAVAVALGALARHWHALTKAVAGLGQWATTAVAAGAAVLVNNLPAAALLSARAPAHPRALLLGLDLGPNLAVTGSLCALIWWRVARGLDARPSIARFSKVGLLIAPLSMAAALGALLWLQPPR
jgi:arsenical pump membrane protein